MKIKKLTNEELKKETKTLKKFFLINSILYLVGLIFSIILLALTLSTKNVTFLIFLIGMIFYTLAALGTWVYFGLMQEIYISRLEMRNKK